MPARLLEAFATTTPFADLFSDQSVLQAMLDVEAALARAEAKAGIVPSAAAESIAVAARAESFDAAALAGAALRAGTLSIPVVKALTDRVRARDPQAAGFVHWGATSQDVADTALVLLLKKSQGILDLLSLEKSLGRLSEEHAHTVMLGRTLMQPAPPITFGLKAAGWLGSVRRGRRRLDVAFAEALVLQFGGASGTLAALDDQGLAVAQTLAADLGLALPDAPWHTQRDRLAALLSACGVLVGSLAKMARDLSLLMQAEVAEVSEPTGEGRGGSSTMPHKRNPVGCMATLAAAHRVSANVAAFLSAMVQEHERGVGGWQAEWPIVAAVMQGTAVAVASMAEVAEGLSVDSARMRANLEATNGAIFAERAMMLLAPKLGRDVAHKLLEATSRKSAAEKRRLKDVLAEMPEVTRHLDKTTLAGLESPELYLGTAETFRKRLLASTGQPDDGEKEQ
jgi:3-carboxy-cis,cis-muconate cycloisomerase